MNPTSKTAAPALSAPPVNQYTAVAVHPIQHSGNLNNGTGTLSEIGVFSCGPFTSGDLPVIGQFYNISGTSGGKTYQFPGWKCTHAGPTSDFNSK